MSDYDQIWVVRCWVLFVASPNTPHNKGSSHILVTLHELMFAQSSKCPEPPNKKGRDSIYGRPLHIIKVFNMQSRLRGKTFNYPRHLWMIFSLTLVSFLDIYDSLHTKQKFLLSHLRYSDFQKIKVLLQIFRSNQIDQDASTRNTWVGSQGSVDRHHPRRRWVRGRRCSGSRHPNLDGNSGCKQGYRQVDTHLVPYYGLQVR